MNKRTCGTIIAVLLMVWPLVGAKTVRFSDVGWDSIKLNNALAGFVAEKGFGLQWTETPGSTPIIHEALVKGDVDVVMEEWTDNIPSYKKDLAAGKFVELGVNFNDNFQGFYIPAYVAEAHPDLRSVKDLARHADLFPDPEQKGRSRIYGGIPGWSITEIMGKKVEAYGLDASFNYVVPGSNAALDSAIIASYDRKEPIVTYYWEPTWLLGMYDFVLLADEPFDEKLYPQGLCSAPAVTVTVAVSNEFASDNPEFCAFLSRYHLSSSLISEGLAYMKVTNCSHSQAARQLLSSHPELLESWLDGKTLANVRDALGSAAQTKAKGVFRFPFSLDIDTTGVDASVRDAAAKSGSSLKVVQGMLGGLINGLGWLLSRLPWFVLVALVFSLGWKSSGKPLKGAVYAALFCVIGLLGLWDEMTTTLSIVLSSVLLALVLGFPIGVWVSVSERANKVLRPILDTMQTMPVFVYLIPALLFFGMGGPSAVIATVVYAVVPVIRLTSLGIRQVDPEVVEAAVAFGSTRWQTLCKVQIPQALPTIMTGVNQTLMMAMAMVVTCSMIGARGLGMEVLNAVNRIEIGRGLVAGSCVVIMAIVMDRITQGGFSKEQQNEQANDNH